MFDTHTHLQFQAFDGITDQVIKEALGAGVEKMVVVGTNVETSKKAVGLAQKYDCLYAAVGIHPHHIFEYISHSHLEETSEGSLANASSNQLRDSSASYQNDIKEIEKLIKQPKVIAVGEV